MPAYDFNRKAFALQRQMTRPTGQAYEAPAVFKVSANDGTVIPYP